LNSIGLHEIDIALSPFLVAQPQTLNILYECPFKTRGGKMSTLSTLKLVDFHKPTSMPPIVQRRNKVIAKLWEQQKLAESLGTGSPYAPIKSKRIKDIEGNIKQVEVPKRIKPWWFTSESGKTCLAIKYGNQVVEISKGKQAIELSSPKELVSLITQLRQAVEAGELDSQIDQASASVRARFSK
jgi:hypothetical protein